MNPVIIALLVGGAVALLLGRASEDSEAGESGAAGAPGQSGAAGSVDPAVELTESDKAVIRDGAELPISTWRTMSSRRKFAFVIYLESIFRGDFVSAAEVMAQIPDSEWSGTYVRQHEDSERFRRQVEGFDPSVIEGRQSSGSTSTNGGSKGGSEFTSSFLSSLFGGG